MPNSVIALLGAQTEGIHTAQLVNFHSMPIYVYVPTGYEPNYAYPLVVLLHNEGGNDEQMVRNATRISRRNCLCVTIRGPKVLPEKNEDGRPTYGWGQPGEFDAVVREYILAAITHVRRNYHIHSERIFLAGQHEGAEVAYRVGLQMPEKFGGLIALNGTLPRPFALPTTIDANYQHLRILIAHGAANEAIPLEMARQDYLALYSAGTDVTLNTYPTTHKIDTHMWRDMNRWIMHHIMVDNAFDAQEEDFDE
jgi:phospholipase/carboxylesterase